MSTKRLFTIFFFSDKQQKPNTNGEVHLRCVYQNNLTLKYFDQTMKIGFEEMFLTNLQNPTEYFVDKVLVGASIEAEMIFEGLKY